MLNHSIDGFHSILFSVYFLHTRLIWLDDDNLVKAILIFGTKLLSYRLNKNSALSFLFVCTSCY